MLPFTILVVVDVHFHSVICYTANASSLRAEFMNFSCFYPDRLRPLQIQKCQRLPWYLLWKWALEPYRRLTIVLQIPTEHSKTLLSSEQEKLHFTVRHRRLWCTGSLSREGKVGFHAGVSLSGATYEVSSLPSSNMIHGFYHYDPVELLWLWMSQSQT